MTLFRKRHQKAEIKIFGFLMIGMYQIVDKLSQKSDSLSVFDPEKICSD